MKQRKNAQKRRFIEFEKKDKCSLTLIHLPNQRENLIK